MDGDLEFRRRLYKISTHLSTDDVSNMKFYCTDDYLSRRQLETVQSGFHLFCQLLDKGTLSKDNTGLLKELLELVHKKDLLQLLCGRPLQEGTLRSGQLADPVFKPLLKEVGDSLPQKQLKDVVYFFSSSALAVQDVEDLKKPEEIFQKLKDSGTSVDTLLMVLEAIGRQDLCGKVRKSVQANTELTPAGAMSPTGAITTVREMSREGTATDNQECFPIEEQSGRLDNSPGSLRSHGHPTSLMSPGSVPVFCGPHSTQFRDGVYRGPSSSDTQGSETGEAAASHNEVWKLKEMEQVMQGKMREARMGAQHPNDSSHLLEEIQAEWTERLVRTGVIELYPMSCTPHGIALIIVNENFNSTHLQDRTGSAVDQSKFSTLFQSLGYIVKEHRNLTSSDMLQEVKRVACLDHNCYDSFVICVSTHGTETSFYGTDRMVKREDLYTPIKMCDTLRGKPKMFFIQACEAEVVMDGSVVKDGPMQPHRDGPMQPHRDGPMQPHRDRPMQPHRDRPMQPHRAGPVQPHRDRPMQPHRAGPVQPHRDADCFYANATTTQNSAYRNTQSGSWFATALFKVFSKEKTTHTLTSMMRHVNALLQEESMTGENPSVPSDGCLQCAEVITTCTKEIVFNAC